jgi:hypothetical protein
VTDVADTPEPEGLPLAVDATAASADPNLPAFLARPDDAPVYHGFEIVDGLEVIAWRLGLISARGKSAYGDAFLVSPDDARAGLVWEVGTDPVVHTVAEPEPTRWGVWALELPRPMDTDDDLRRNLEHLVRVLAPRWQDWAKDQPGPGGRRCVGDLRPTAELVTIALADLRREDEEGEDEWPRSIGDEEVLLDAVVALQHRPTDEVFEAMRTLSEADDPYERQLAALVLGQFQYFGGQLAFVEQSIDVLLEMTADEPDGDPLAEIARAFGYRDATRGFDLLLKWRHSDYQPTRFKTTISLPSCIPPGREDEAVAALVALSLDVSEPIRDYALFGLTNLGIDTPAVREAMLARLDDESGDVVGQALVGLARLGDERALEPLSEFLLTGPENKVWSYGIDAAALFAKPALLPALRGAEGRGFSRDSVDRAIQACETGQRSDYLD